MSASATPSQFRVRAGTVADLAGVRALIVELAEYEREGGAVSLTLQRLQADAKAGYFTWTVAEANDGRLVGMALHYPRYSTWKGRTWYLEDLVVTESWRGRGIGLALFGAVAEHAANQAAERLEWQVLDWNEPAIGFYKKIGASLDGAWLNGRLTRHELRAFLARPASPRDPS